MEAVFERACEADFAGVRSDGHEAIEAGHVPFRRNRGSAMNRETYSTNTPWEPVVGYSRARVFGIRLDPLGYTLMES